MELNEGEFQYMSHNFKKTLLDHLPFSNEYNSYTTMNGQVLEPLDDILDLGIHISADLS